MEALIKKFCEKHLPDFELQLENSERSEINLFVVKYEDKYILQANLNTLGKMKLTDEELTSLLMHEKGHYELKHLEGENNCLINSMLIVILSVIFVFLMGINIIFPVHFLLFTITGLVVSWLAYDNLKVLKLMRQKEMEADQFACQFNSPHVFISTLQKMDKFYQVKTKKKYKNGIFSTHPNIEDRILKINSRL